MNPKQQPPTDELGYMGELKAIYGQRADHLWYRIMATRNPQRKARLLQRAELQAAEVQHKGLNSRKIRLVPPPENIISGGEYVLGKIVFPAVVPYPVTIGKKELIRHFLADGPSGSGKTTLILDLMEQVQDDGTPWLALDWKGSFRVMLRAAHGEDVIVLTTGSDVAPLRVNVLLPPPGVSTMAWVENIADTLCVGYSLLDGARSKLIDVFLEAIEHYGERATLRDAFAFLKRDFSQVEAWRKRGLAWMESTERAFKRLTQPPFGDCLNEREHPMPVGELLQRNVVIELKGLGEAQATTVSVFFLQATLLVRQHQEGPREELRHVTILDESQNIFRPQPHWEKPNLPNRLIAECREFGEAVVAGTQGVGVSEQLLTNTATKAIMRTSGKWDLDYFSRSLTLSPLDLSSIPIGQAIGLIPSWPRPFLFSFRENKLKNKIVTDEEISARYNNWRAGKPLTTSGPVKPVVGERELTLLASIATNPLLSITEHYAAIPLHAKAGNTTKERLLRSGLISIEAVEYGRAHKKFPTLTNTGEQLMIEKQIPITSIGPRSIEHENARQELRKICEEHGYTVSAEHRLGNGRVDLYVTKGERTLLIEVETGKSNVTANITKCHGHGQLVLFFTNIQAYKKHEKSIPQDVIILTPTTIDFLNQLLT